MGATFAAIGAYLSGSAAAATAATAVVGAEVAATVAATELAMIGAGATAAEAGLAATALGGTMGAGGAAAGGALGGGIMSTMAKTGAQAVGTSLISSILAPEPPQPPNAGPVTPMPDPLAQAAARKKSIIEQTSRRGRASTIMTSPTGGSLGG